MAELKPCPFCGGEAKFVDCGGVWCAIICEKCNATTDCIMSSTQYAAREKVIKLWNRRCGDATN